MTSDLVHNERIKYLATFLNTTAVASVAAGVIAPIVALTYGAPGPIGGAIAILISLAWLLCGAVLHVTVRCSRKAPRMSLLGWYVAVGLPLILLGMGYGAVRLAARDAAKRDRQVAARNPQP